MTWLHVESFLFVSLAIVAFWEIVVLLWAYSRLVYSGLSGGVALAHDAHSKRHERLQARIT